MENQPRLPKEFEERLQRTLGDDFEQFVDSLQQPPSVSIRLNPKKYFEAQQDQVPWSEHGRYLMNRPVFTLDPAFHAGAYYVQEASSMLLEQAIVQSTDLSQPLRVLDLCAAPGGKSTHLLSLISDDSVLVSNEVIRTRASVLSENIQKWGKSNVVVSNNDPADFARLPGFFDVMVIDAPCSGEGLFRKDPNAMNEWSNDHVTLCAQRQQRILSDAWPALKENGILIYATCTYNEKENEDNLAWLGEAHEVEFIPLNMKEDWGIEEIKKGNVIGYRCYPHKVKGEGFFISVIKKKETTPHISIRTKTIFNLAPKKIAARLNEWVADEFEYILQDDLLLMIPKVCYDQIEFISSRLKLITKGTAIATIKHEKLIPEHALALSVSLRKEVFPTFDLSLEEALAYLRKGNLLIGEQQKGFALMLYQHNAIGWVNLLGNRLNNLYPANWRIRMQDQ